MDNNDSLRGHLRSDLSSKGWWYGAIGGVLSTVIGIALTFGVSAWVSYRNDKQQAREMMFHVLMTTENNIVALEMTDTIDSLQDVGTKKMLAYYQQTGGHLESIVDSVPMDTLQDYLSDVFACIHLNFTRSKTENYFYNAQTMHQFGDPQLFADFALFVQRDKETFARIDGFQKQSMAMYCKWRTIALLNANNQINGLIALQKMIEDGYLIELNTSVNTFSCKQEIEHYRSTIRKLLEGMHATQEEYDEYKKEHLGK